MVKAMVGVLAIACLLPLYPGMAMADSEQVVGKYHVHMAADFNKDGKVTLDEHLAWARSVFEQMDLDGDGFISAQEMTEFQFKRLASMRPNSKAKDEGLDKGPEIIPEVKFAPSIDLDGDGRVSLAEHLAYETKIFKSMANSEGVITAKEILAKDQEAKAEIEQRLRLLREQKAAASQQGEIKYGFQK